MRKDRAYLEVEGIQTMLEADRAPIMDIVPASVYETPKHSLEPLVQTLEYKGFADDYLPPYSGDQESPVELPTGMAE